MARIFAVTNDNIHGSDLMDMCKQYPAARLLKTQKQATERKLREQKLTETRANSLYYFFKKQKTKRLSPVKEGNQFFLVFGNF